MIRQPQGYLFGDFELAPEAAELRRGGEVVHLEPRVLQLLLYLIEHRQRLVPKGELLDAVWDESFVTENALTKAIGRLRKALDDDAQQPGYIHTHHTLGYRFIAEVDESGGQTGPPDVGASGVPAARAVGIAVAVVAGGVIAILLGTDAGGVRERLFGDSEQPAIRSLAVLPFKNLTDSPEQDYFVDGMQEALITDLSKIGSMRVISRQSTMRFRGSRQAMPEIARELGVDGLVEGSVMRDGDRVTIWAQLIHGPSDSHRWAEGYERQVEVADVLVLVNEVARTISGDLEVTLAAEGRGLLAAPRVVDPGVHDTYLRARHHLNQATAAGLVKATELYRSTLDLDPTFAPAHAGLAYVHLLSTFRGRPPRETMPLARAAALKAIEHDDQLADAYNVLGWVRLAFDWDWPGSGKAFRRALELNPSDATAHHGYADFLTVMGRPEEGMQHIMRGRDCDPLSPIVYVPVLKHLALLRRDDQVIVESRRALELFPGFQTAQLGLGWALWRQGRHEEALVELRKVPYSDAEFQDVFERALADGGLRAAARARADHLAARSESAYVDPMRIAVHYARAKEVEAAFHWLEQAFENRSPMLMLVNVGPEFDSLRSDPRLQALVQRLGLPDG